MVGSTVRYVRYYCVAVQNPQNVGPAGLILAGRVIYYFSTQGSFQRQNTHKTHIQLVLVWGLPGAQRPRRFEVAKQLAAWQ